MRKVFGNLQNCIYPNEKQRTHFFDLVLAALRIYYTDKQEPDEIYLGINIM